MQCRGEIQRGFRSKPEPDVELGSIHELENRQQHWGHAMVLGLLLCVTGCADRGGTPGACRLPARAKEPVDRFVHVSNVHYAQRDPRWANEPIGGSGKPLAAVGCTICCVSMALTEEGIHTTPAQLNRHLKAVDGYTAKGWVHWPAIESATGGRARAEILWKPTNRDIEQALADGNPVIVKVAPPPMVQHWVLLVGREGQEYLMRDPLDASRSVRPLSSLGSEILAVRVIKAGGR